KSVVSIEEFNKNFEIMQNYWLEKTSSLEFFTKDNETNNYLKWATLQPTLRRIYGCSFLPHHDYGKGGRGFRDLWQDCLSLIKINPSEIKESIINNFAAIRIDGSNATIIGSGVKDFKADRNDIVRMWMDHGVWPFLTTNTYLQTTNDYDMLLEKTSYFKDNHISFSQEIDREWDGCLQQKTKSNEEYEGTLLEHILVQNITSAYNLGKNNNIKLMDADWNDGLDMAHVNGESVSFTALYAQNLKDICAVIDKLKIKKVELFKELADLIEEDYVLDYEVCKQRLSNFFLSVKNKISGKTKNIDVLTLKNKLTLIYQSLESNINKNEWLENNDLGYYNGYYDNDGNKLESAKNSQMVLTSQVFQISSGIASDEKVQKIVDSADKLLYSKQHGGYRLNTNFNEVKTNMGRLFGFAYGHKENGAVFSHMAVMYANSLYKRNFVTAGYKVLNTIKESVCDYKRSKMLPGIPEYFDTNGVGMYPYLTGSASWLLLTMTEEVFGIKRDGKVLNLEPKLTSEEFNKNKLAIINFMLDNKKITVKYKNKNLLEFNEYNITKIKVNGKSTKKILIEKLEDLNTIEVTLG
ncbi:MAG: cellobiose phosphorylase, partial [bacterium]